MYFQGNHLHLPFSTPADWDVERLICETLPGSYPEVGSQIIRI